MSIFIKLVWGEMLLLPLGLLSERGRKKNKMEKMFEKMASKQMVKNGKKW